MAVDRLPRLPPGRRIPTQELGGSQAEDRYNYLYSEAELQPIGEAAKAEAALEKRVLVYFNNHFSAKAVANADILRQQVGELAPDWTLRPY